MNFASLLLSCDNINNQNDLYESHVICVRQITFWLITTNSVDSSLSYTESPF